MKIRCNRLKALDFEIFIVLNNFLNPKNGLEMNEITFNRCLRWFRFLEFLLFIIIS